MVDYAPEFFDPLSTDDLTALICRRFEDQPAQPLAEVPSFDGAGLYAIYYVGTTIPLYNPLSGYVIPLYAGSAQSHNSSTGLGARARRPLYSRVRKHQRSVSQSNLEESEFEVRLLLMPDVHIDLGENGLRVGYKPVWNSVLKGFGGNEQGSATRTSGQTVWDAVHPGRQRTFGKPRASVDSQIEAARILIAKQVEACGTRSALDWAKWNSNRISEPKL